jgi:hypothetical protein
MLLNIYYYHHSHSFLFYSMRNSQLIIYKTGNIKKKGATLKAVKKIEKEASNIFTVYPRKKKSVREKILAIV